MKASIIYYSVTGRTKAMAETIAEGMREEGLEAGVYSIDSVDAEFVKESRCIIIGSPVYFADIAGKMKIFLEGLKPLDPAGKLGGAFATADYSYGGGDTALQTILTHLMCYGMLVYSGGVMQCAPPIHFGPVASSDGGGGTPELFRLYGQRMARKALEMFSRRSIRNSDFLSFAGDRYSVRKLDTRPVEQEKIDRILDAALLAPTACNAQPFRIWMLKSASARERIRQVTDFSFVTEAPVIFVVGADPDRAYTRKWDGFNFCETDAAIAATHMMLEIHDLGLGTTWVGHFDAEKCKELFPEMSRYRLGCIFGVGYPAGDSKPSELHFGSKNKEEMVTEL